MNVQRYSVMIALACAAASVMSAEQLMTVGAAVGLYFGFVRRVNWRLVRTQTSLLWATVPSWARIVPAVIVWRFVPGGTWLVVLVLAFMGRYALAKVAREMVTSLRAAAMAFREGSEGRRFAS